MQEEISSNISALLGKVAFKGHLIIRFSMKEVKQKMLEEKSSVVTGFKKLSLADIALEPTRHGALKKVLLRHEDVSSQLMFLNEVYVAPGETIAAHQHEDMEEIFYFLEGEGSMQIEEEVQSVVPGDRVIIPSQKVHVLENTGEKQMRFICFGVKVLPEGA
jgi:quercetin dioxygenase-like cupin family protein